MSALVAKSYQNLEQLCDPYEMNGKMYVKVRMKNGQAKQVRAYSESEYKRYNPEVVIVKPAKSRRDILGFGEAGYIWIFKGDTYSVVDWFRASPCRYTKIWGWYLPSDIEMPDPIPAGIEPIKLEWSEVSLDDQLIPENDIQKIVDEKLYDAGTSQWLGEVGQRISITVLCKRAYCSMNAYGDSTIHTFESEDGNIFVWMTNAKTLTEGHWYELTGTIKEHSTYKNIKQNILTRCRVINDLGDMEDDETEMDE